ncbi:mucin-associated surface protein [Trypanosoma cruzi cruzi]|uniref:Mucin-associated surface protein (MASP) n=1 Tax=Trypanosoma cruzi TaxID=5693 RepID=A0A2V2VXC2_TRYCR|nr:mucin-associated surface protein [Trypanosoma cruzi cruzi]PWV01018.1 Mucin-associated surface protein (MASP) [Trypanosoma cruzi]
MAMMMTGRVLLVCALCVLWCTIGVVADGNTEEVVESVVPLSGPNGSQQLQEEDSRRKGRSENDEQVDGTQMQKQRQDGEGHQEGSVQPAEQSVGLQLQSDRPRVEEAGKRTEKEQLQRGKQPNPSVEHQTPPNLADKYQERGGKGDVPEESGKQKEEEIISQSGGETESHGKEKEKVATGPGSPELIVTEISQEASRSPPGKPLAENEQIAKENVGKKEEKDKQHEKKGDPHVQQQNGNQEKPHGSPAGSGSKQSSLATLPPEELQQKQTSAGSTSHLEGEAPLIGTESTSNGNNDPSLPSVSTHAGVAATHETDKEDAKVRPSVESTETTVNETDEQHEHLTESDKESMKDKTGVGANSTANTAGSDGSTAASHTTFPLLLLLVVACAAAAAVVAA